MEIDSKSKRWPLTNGEPTVSTPRVSPSTTLLLPHGLLPPSDLDQVRWIATLVTPKLQLLSEAHDSKSLSDQTALNARAATGRL